MMTPEMQRKVDIFHKVLVERKRQDVKWGPQSHLDLKWFTVMTEEFGEVAKCLNELEPATGILTADDVNRYNDQLEEEIIQVIASGFAWLEYKKTLREAAERKADGEQM